MPTRMPKKQSLKLPLVELTSIGPIDGRYRSRVAELSPYVSEYGLIKTRLKVEARFLIALSAIGIVRRLTSDERETLMSFGEKIGLREAKRVKEIEDETRHDVKAVERAFREMVKGSTLQDLTEMVHFGLTSEDINNLAYRLMLKEATTEVVIPTLDQLIDELIIRAEKYKKMPMLARTHGQSAVPTTVGKELIVFASRLNGEVRKLEDVKLTGKLTGAVGNFNALLYAFSDVDWIRFCENFVKGFNLEPNLTTTQINPYEDIIEYFQNYQRINSVIVDLDQDMWRYISDGWFAQEVKKGEVGSSTMPQKVNPIDFENSEGNLTIANGIFETLSRKLATSRLQRDLSDSTTIRNIGTVLAYSLIGYKSALNGFSRIKPSHEQITNDLNSDWSILAEGVQTFLRKAGVPDPYSLIATLTGGEHIDQEKWRKFIDSLPIKENQKKALQKLTPANYIGLAVELTERAIREIKSSRTNG